jgi:hypothetical protein
MQYTNYIHLWFVLSAKRAGFFHGITWPEREWVNSLPKSIKFAVECLALRKSHLNLYTSDTCIPFVRPFVKFLNPLRQISGYIKLADLFHVIRISSLVINLKLCIM